jgi:hypothetical protein
VKDAIVEWGMPATISNFQFKIYNYAKWDAVYKIWWHPSQRLASHNIKALFVLFRYVIGLFLLILSFKYTTLPFLTILIFVYLIWAYRKVYLEFGDWKVSLWGPVIQITADLAVMRGFLTGFFQ